LLKMVLSKERKKEILHVLEVRCIGQPIGPPARADDQVQHLRPVGLHAPILITFRRRSSKAAPKKPEARVTKRESRVCDRS
jgi:hypothetical protein